MLTLPHLVTRRITNITITTSNVSKTKKEITNNMRLEPRAYNKCDVKRHLSHQKRKQNYYHDKNSKLLHPLRIGDKIRIAPRQNLITSTPGTFVNHNESPKSYVVRPGSKIFSNDIDHYDPEQISPSTNLIDNSLKDQVVCSNQVSGDP